jgi:hypothetical protein
MIYCSNIETLRIILWDNSQDAKNGYKYNDGNEAHKHMQDHI